MQRALQVLPLVLEGTRVLVVDESHFMMKNSFGILRLQKHLTTWSRSQGRSHVSYSGTESTIRVAMK